MEKLEKIKVGIVGVGAISQVAYLPALSSIEDYSIVAICDEDILRSKGVSLKYNIKYVFDDYEKMLKDSDTDVIIINTPNYLHFPMIMASLEYGKDVIVEMPLCFTQKEFEELKKEVGKKNKIVMPALSGRFRKDAKYIHNIITSGELGPVVYSKAGWLKSLKTREKSWKDSKIEAGGGVIMILGLNILDYYIWALGKEVDTVYALLHKKEEVEDSGIVFLRFKDGTFGVFEVSWTILFDRDFTYFNVYCERGTAIMNPFKIEKLYQNEILDLTPSDIQRVPYYDSYNAMLRHFVDVYRGRTKLLYTIDDANYILKIVNACYESFDKKCEVKVS
jgi:predicted dehydrogenase